MKIIKILLLSAIILIFFIYINKIEGIDIIDPSSEEPNVHQEHRRYYRDILDKINEKKILIKINKSNLLFLSDYENSSLINKEIIATINVSQNSGYLCSKLDDTIRQQLYFPCTYRILLTQNKNNNITSDLFTKISDFLNGGIIPSKSYNKLRKTFKEGSEYKYHLSNNLNILHINKLVRHNDDVHEIPSSDFIELEIIDYLDTETNEEIKITKEKIKKYIYSQFLQ